MLLHVLAWLAELMLAVGMLCFFVAATDGAASGARAVVVLLLVSLEMLYVGQKFQHGSQKLLKSFLK